MKNKSYGKGFILLIIALGLIIMGGTYSSWSNLASIDYKMSSGNMNIVFPFQNNTDYKVELVNNNDIFDKISAEFKISDNGKTADIMFKQGLPIHELMEGKMIRICFPMKAATNSSINAIKPKELDFSEVDGNLTMNVAKGIIVEADKYYEMRNNNIYMRSLKFDMYSELDVKEDKSMTGNLYLRLSKESREYIDTLPSKVKIDGNDVVEIEKPDFAVLISNGIVIEYLVNISLKTFQP